MRRLLAELRLKSPAEQPEWARAGPGYAVWVGEDAHSFALPALPAREAVNVYSCAGAMTQSLRVPSQSERVALWPERLLVGWRARDPQGMTVVGLDGPDGPLWARTVDEADGFPGALWFDEKRSVMLASARRPEGGIVVTAYDLQGGVVCRGARNWDDMATSAHWLCRGFDGEVLLQAQDGDYQARIMEPVLEANVIVLRELAVLSGYATVVGTTSSELIVLRSPVPPEADSRSIYLSAFDRVSLAVTREVDLSDRRPARRGYCNQGHLTAKHVVVPWSGSSGQTLTFMLRETFEEVRAIDLEEDYELVLAGGDDTVVSIRRGPVADMQGEARLRFEQVLGD